MFLWGLDAAKASGNLLVAHGFERRPSPGLQGTSCYRRAWRHGAIELHGSYAGFQTASGGAYYSRPLGRCVRWHDSRPPIPGAWDRQHSDARQTPELLEDLQPLLEWWLAHDRRVTDELGSAWRLHGYRQYRKLPKTRPWLAPSEASDWLQSLLRDPSTTPRARRFAPRFH